LGSIAGDKKTKFLNVLYKYKDMGNYIELVKKYFPFSENETKGFFIAVIAMTFVVAFNDNSDSFVLSHWVGNFLIWLVIVFVSFFIHTAGYRLAALKVGYRHEFQLWWYGLLFGLIIMLLSRGSIWVLIPAGVWIHHMAIHRLGKFRYGPNVFSFAMVSLMGPLSSILFAGVIKTFQVWFGLTLISADFVQKIFIFNMAFAAYSLAPIPPLAGSRIFFSSRLTYVLIAASVIGYAVLIWFNVYSYLFALVIGVIAWFLFYLLFEKGAWKF